MNKVVEVGALVAHERMINKAIILIKYALVCVASQLLCKFIIIF